MKIKSFKISGHSTKRNWAVYLIVAKPINLNEKIMLYVGKVGDNRDGCNPVISRVGNHFSFTKTHSQIRTALNGKKTEDYNYEYFYCHFEEYEDKKSLQIKSRMKTDELERELNRIVQKRMDKKTSELMNPFSGKTISKAKTAERAKLINKQEIEMLEKLCAKAL
jgi:hypothetical protein